MLKVSQFLNTALWVVVILGAGFFILRQEVTSKLYKQKIDELSEEYALLSTQYNEVVKQTAITELEVTKSSVNVLVRTLDGSVRRVETPYDPSAEIYVDYVLQDGRIWIRRIFDQATAPEKALIIEPEWALVDWSDPAYTYGKAVYRSLSPGTWSIQVSGNGALSLMPVETLDKPMLAYRPGIEDFAEWRVQIEQDRREIGFSDIWAFAVSLLPN